MLEIGTIGEAAYVADDDDMASTFCTGEQDVFPEVFSTARMIALMERKQCSTTYLCFCRTRYDALASAPSINRSRPVRWRAAGAAAPRSVRAGFCA
jgi:hypothetical protein